MRRSLLLWALTLCCPPIASADDVTPVAIGTRVRVSTGPRVESGGFAISSSYQKGRSIAEDEQSITFERNGQALRLPRPGVSLIGTLQALDDRSFTLESGGASQIVIPRDAVAKLQVQRGRRNHAAQGAGSGFAIGAPLGFAFSGTCILGSNCETTTGDRLRGVAIGGAIGATLGAVIGAAIKGDRWQDAHISVAPAHRGAALSLALRF